MKREIKLRHWTGEEMVAVHKITFDDDKLIVSGGGVVHFADSSTVMPYTGLKDKNGREIYEGDIVSFGSVWNNGDNEDIDEEIHIGVVEYDPHYAVYDVNCEGSGERRFLFMDIVNYDGYGVIGNIFENPELLEGKQ